MNKEKPKWREEFKKKFPVDSFYGLILCEEKEIESLIEMILKSKQEEIERAIDKKIWVMTGHPTHQEVKILEAHNKEIKDLKPIISNLLK